MRVQSLAGRLVRWQVAMTLILWVVLVGWLFQAMTRYEHGDLDHRMRYFAEILAAAASGADSAPDALARRVESALRMAPDL